MGRRRTSEWMLTPSTRRFFATLRLIRLITAGSEIAVHEMKNSEPTNTAHQVGTRITTR